MTSSLINGRVFLEQWNVQIDRAKQLIGDDSDSQDELDDLLNVDDLRIKNLDDIIEEKVLESEKLV